jgi:endonuclease/exonuclease/phosphatase family metal-dependent hydrolase
MKTLSLKSIKLKGLFLLPLVGLIFLSSCGSSGEPEPKEIILDFARGVGFVASNAPADVVLITLSQPAPGNGYVDVTVTDLTAVYGVNYTLVPEKGDTSIRVHIVKGARTASFFVLPQLDEDEVSNAFHLEITGGSHSYYQPGANATTLVYVTEAMQGGGSVDYTCNGQEYTTSSLLCTPGLSDTRLDIVTWNIKNFTAINTDINKVKTIIMDLDADIYALQEISSISAFNTMVSELDGYSGIVVDVRGGQELAFLYKTSEIVAFGTPEKLFPSLSSPFPREPVLVEITHANGITTRLINVHLKCCGGAENVARRTEAAQLLKSYVDTNFPNDPVIILGDWNEGLNIAGSFGNFIQDPDNYLFADKPINDGPVSNWSYPSWPSHLDHILMTNELCDNLRSAHVLRLNDCVDNYNNDVSDHRPMMVQLGVD